MKTWLRVFSWCMAAIAWVAVFACLQVYGMYGHPIGIVGLALWIAGTIATVVTLLGRATEL